MRERAAAAAKCAGARSLPTTTTSSTAQAEVIRAASRWLSPDSLPPRSASGMPVVLVRRTTTAALALM